MAARERPIVEFCEGGMLSQKGIAYHTWGQGWLVMMTREMRID